MRGRVLVPAMLALGALVGLRAGATEALFGDAPALGSNNVSTATLQPPAGLSAGAGCQLLAPRITLTWTATTSAFGSGYDVYRSTTSGGPYSAVAHVNGRSTTTYIDSGGLSLNTTYYYVLKSTASSWTSVNSGPASAKTPGLCVI